MIWNVIICSLALTSFREANALYDAGNFAGAAAAFERVEPKTANVNFNLGNAYFREGKFGAAILSYQRAREHAPRDPDILANLRFAEQRARVDMINTPGQPVKRFIHNVVFSRTTNEWAVYELVAFWICVLAIGATILFQKVRMAAVVLGGFVGCAFFCATSALCLQLYWKRIRPAGIVVSKTEALFAPLADSTVHFQLPEGTSVIIQENRGQWLLVERLDGQQGWARAEVVGSL
jgi:tetratricopeptide (TPR) repeat protein